MEAARLTRIMCTFLCSRRLPRDSRTATFVRFFWLTVTFLAPTLAAVALPSFLVPRRPADAPLRPPVTQLPRLAAPLLAAPLLAAAAKQT